MMRAWLALALLAVSWLPGLSYYQSVGWIAWAVPVVLGAALLAGVPARMPRRHEAVGAAILLLPVVALLPWPYRVIPVLAAAGLVLGALPISGRWLAAVARGLVVAAGVLLVQWVAVSAYAQHTARAHDLRWPLTAFVGAIGSLVGTPTTVDGHWLCVFSLREVHRIAITWELLLDPATLAFFAGGWALLAMASHAGAGDGKAWAGWVRSVRVFTLAMLVWLPVRAGLVVGLLIHRAARTSPSALLNMSDFLFSPWLYLGLLGVPAVLAWHFVPLRAVGDVEPPAVPSGSQSGKRRWSYGVAIGLVAGGAAVFVMVLSWDPIGSRKPGRVMVVERHSTWEPTTRPYDTRTYGESASYTYSAIYDYCSRFFEMSRLLESDRIDDERLSRCDVLVIKTPTAPYTNDEVAAIVRFVRQGGGLLLVGEHTDVFKSSTYLNQVAEPLGFRFRKDLLFRIGSAYVQHYVPPAVPHPAIAHLPPMVFAVSCSIDPGQSLGRAIIGNSGLWSLPPDYSTENYFPEAEYRGDAHYGSFIQLWGTWVGRGRVLAWTDSTIFSNFSAFEPGKPELMLGMLDWLNHRSALDNAWLRYPIGMLAGLAGLGALLGGLVVGGTRRVYWVVLAAAALLGWTCGSAATAAMVRWAMPPVMPFRPMVCVTIDRTVSEVPLSQGGFTARGGQGYGLLEQWIPRVGYFPERRSGRAAFSGNALIEICPSRALSKEHRQGLIDYVAAGGRLLVLDAPDNAGSTASSILEPFGLSFGKVSASSGLLHGEDSWPGIAVEGAWPVGGGQPLLWVGQTPVAARAKYGKGTVIAVGCASLLNDANMGGHWMAQPDESTQKHFALWYGLLRNLVEDRPIR